MENKTLQFQYMGYIDVNILLDKRITAVANGKDIEKSYVYNILKQYSLENNENILCINNDNADEYTLSKIKKLQDAIIIINEADTVLDKYIDLDRYIREENDSNYYVMLGIKITGDTCSIQIEK